MNVSLDVYVSQGEHRVTVVARPRVAAQLGEFVLVESEPLRDLPDDPSALDVLRAAYRVVAHEIAGRPGRAPVES